MGKTRKIDIGTFTGVAKLGAGINISVDIKGKLSDYAKLTADNFCPLLNTITANDPYKQGATYSVTNVKVAYTPSTGIVTITSGWSNSDTSGSAYENIKVDGTLYCFTV